MLSIRSLTAGYGKLEILHQLNVDIQLNRMTTILGANGSGKSTLLKSIFGLTTITGGSIQYSGRELVGVPTEQIGAFGIAYVPQRQNIFASMTVRENLALAVRKANRAEAYMRIEGAFHLFPILEKRANQRTVLMSGGERQMVAIAMGWLMNPKLMLLDEPTAGLAPLVAKEVFETLHNLSEQGITLVVVEQNARTALRWCKDVCILREGALVFQGTSDAFADDDSLLHTYLGLLSAPNLERDN
jgi:branched-chain amino acid transport system ATP-binding protein